MTTPTKITILLAEDHAIVRQGLCALLKTDGHFLITGEARTGREAVDMARSLRPDVILMDIAMPVLNGVEATRQILAVNPAAKIVVLSAHNDAANLDRALAAGGIGFLEKQTSAEILTKAIRAVAQGTPFFSPAIARRLRENQARPRDPASLLPADAPHLTSRQAEVLQLVAEGSSNKQVAVALGISLKMAEKHRQHLKDRLKIQSTAGLTRFAIATGVIESRVQATPKPPA
jgi:DNA-binding NarL/FixJ family response regulator